MKKLVIGLVIVALIIGGVVLGVKRLKGAKADNNNKEKVIPVVVSEVKKTDLLETMTCFGTVKAMNQVDVYTKVGGRVEEMFVRAGDEVTVGKVLLVVEHSMIKAQIEQSQASREMAQAQLKQIETNLANLERELARISALSKEGAVSESRQDQIETQYKSMIAQKEATLAQIRQLDAVIQQAKIQGDEAYIKAPISGVVSQKYVELGDMVTPQRPVFTVIQIDTVKITSTIPETILSKVKKGETVALITVDAYQGNIFNGIISYLAPTVDQRTRNVDMEIELENKGTSLKPGMFSRIELVLDHKKDIIAIAKDLLVYDMSGGDFKGYVVYVVDGKVAQKKGVQTGIYSRGLVEIKEGLSEGDKIITSVGPHIYEGCNVEVINEETK